MGVDGRSRRDPRLRLPRQRLRILIKFITLIIKILILTLILTPRGPPSAMRKSGAAQAMSAPYSRFGDISTTLRARRYKKKRRHGECSYPGSA
jgi:hypothetical protein